MTEQIMTVSIGKNENCLPKSNLRYDEYLAIRNEFSAYNYRMSLKGLSVLFVSHFTILAFSKILRKLRRLWGKWNSNFYMLLQENKINR